MGSTRLLTLWIIHHLHSFTLLITLRNFQIFYSAAIFPSEQFSVLEQFYSERTATYRFRSTFLASFEPFNLTNSSSHHSQLRSKMISPSADSVSGLACEVNFKF